MSKTDWRAEQTSDETWAVIGEDGLAIAKHLNEPTALLIAAAPDCVDELTQWFRACTNPHISAETYWNSWDARKQRIEAALKKAGAT